MNFSIYTRMGILMNNPETKKILLKHLGEGLFDHPKIHLASGLSLKNMAQFSNGEITEELLELIDNELRHVK